jgi:hypothetical protein
VALTKAAPAQRVEWEQHRRWVHSRWNIGRGSGQHVSIIGPTGRGKTVFVRETLLSSPKLAKHRVLYVDCKGDDPEITGAYKPVRHFPSRLERSLSVRQEQHYRLVDPNRAEAWKALDAAYKEGDWLIVFDEFRDVTDPKPPNLGLAAQCAFIYRKGRTRGVLFLSCTQAPRWVPREFYESPELLYIGQTRDRDVRRRLREIGGDTEMIEAGMLSLRRYEFLCVWDNGEKCAIVKVPAEVVHGG